MPETASTAKIDLLKKMILGTNVSLKFFGKECVHSEYEAMRVAKEIGATYVSPYNDIQIMGG